MEETDVRQRIDRWIDESQYLIGRLIPGLLDDRDRLRGRVDAAEHECQRLRDENVELRRDLGHLQGETQHLRNEHAAITEALSQVLDHLSQAQKPLHDAHRRLQNAQPAGVPNPAA